MIISFIHPYFNQSELIDDQYKMVVLFYLTLFIFMVHWFKEKREMLLGALNWVIFCFLICYSFFLLSLYFTERFTTLAIICKLIGVLCLIRVVLIYFKKLNTDMDDHAVASELELLFEQSGDAIVVYREDLSIVRSNCGFKHMFGYNDDEALTVKTLIPDDFMEEYYGLLEQLNDGVPVVNFQTKRRRKDSSIIDISISTSMINRDGEILYAAILRDITEQKQAENELIKARQELEETLELHNGIIFRVRKVGNRFVHPLIGGKLLRDTNINYQSFRGKELKDILPKQYAEQLEAYYEQAWGGNEQVFQMKLSDYTYLLSLMPKVINGKVVEMIGTCSDITEAIKTEEVLRKSEKLSVVGELAAGLAHEIRNPLTTIKGFLQLMQQQKVRINDEYLSIILNEIDHLEMITNEFMAVAKPEVVRYQKENLYDLIYKVNRFLRPQALLNNIDLHVDKEVETAYVYADQNQLKQVFINLYKNAIEAMAEGGEIVTTIRMYEDQMVSITIKDQGCGIPAHLIDRLGEPFYTLKEKGTGLGLMVTKKIIDSHDGFIDIYSKEHVGTTVTITLPLFQEDRSSDEQLDC